MDFWLLRHQPRTTHSPREKPPVQRPSQTLPWRPAPQRVLPSLVKWTDAQVRLCPHVTLNTAKFLPSLIARSSKVLPTPST